MTVVRQVVRLMPVTSGRQRLTVDATVGGVSLTVPSGAIAASLRLETAQIRFTLDGSAPQSGSGRLMEVGETLDLESNEELDALKAIRTGGTSGVLDVEFFQETSGPEVQ